MTHKKGKFLILKNKVKQDEKMGIKYRVTVETRLLVQVMLRISSMISFRPAHFCFVFFSLLYQQVVSLENHIPKFRDTMEAILHFPSFYRGSDESQQGTKSLSPL